jgi:hypothetical protein
MSTASGRHATEAEFTAHWRKSRATDFWPRLRRTGVRGLDELCAPEVGRKPLDLFGGHDFLHPHRNRPLRPELPDRRGTITARRRSELTARAVHRADAAPARPLEADLHLSHSGYYKLSRGFLRSRHCAASNEEVAALQRLSALVEHGSDRAARTCTPRSWAFPAARISLRHLAALGVGAPCPGVVL